MRKIVALFLFISLAGCTPRVEYEQSQPFASVTAIDINTATVEELDKLPGIGEKTAEAIVNHRSEHGAFRRVEHIMLVPRISERRFAELAPYLRVQ
jgi:competence protein ComEA